MGSKSNQQAALLQGLGVDELQGYLFGKPQTAAELEALLAVTPQPSRTAP